MQAAEWLPIAAFALMWGSAWIVVAKDLAQIKKDNRKK